MICSVAILGLVSFFIVIEPQFRKGAIVVAYYLIIEDWSYLLSKVTDVFLIFMIL